MEGNNKIEIQHPEAWELLVLIGDSRVSYILYTPHVANSLIMARVERTDDTLKGLEDAIYDTPELLNEYKRVRVVVDSHHFVLLPEETEDADCMALVHSAFPGDDGDAAVNHLPGNGVKIAYLLPKGLQAFLGRTFNYPAVCHRLVSLCEHCREDSQGSDVSRMYVHLCPDMLDVFIFKDCKIHCVNTFPFSDVQDAVYYVMSAWRAHGMDQLTDELQLMGDNEVRAQMTPELREFVKFVMPAVYPAAAMHLGRNAMQAPFELILLALCE